MFYSCNFWSKAHGSSVEIDVVTRKIFIVGWGGNSIRLALAVEHQLPNKDAKILELREVGPEGSLQKLNK